MRKIWFLVTLLLMLWATRVTALEQFPLHNDEGLHLTRAVEVWHLHPFWEINDGKIINHWLIAAFYPQNAPVFAGRIATVVVGMVGLAAGYTLVYSLWGQLAAILAGVLWITSPYLFLYERFAFSDAETGALVVLALLGSVYTARKGSYRDAALTGLALATAMLFKLTAVPFVATIGLVVLFTGHVVLKRRIVNLMIIGGIVAASFAIPVVYLVGHGAGFQIALAWLVSSQPGQSLAPGANLATLWAQLVGYGTVVWSLLMGVGLVSLLVLGLIRLQPSSPAPSPAGEGKKTCISSPSPSGEGFRVRATSARLGLTLIVAWIVPLAVIVVLGTEVMPRHFVVALPAALILAGGGLSQLIGALLCRLRDRRAVWIGAAAITAVLVVTFVPFAATAYSEPANLTLPPLERAEYVTGYSAGFGLREAVLAFPQTITEPGAMIVGSLYPDSCRRANFYAAARYTMICTGAPGTPEIIKALAAHGSVYVLAEKPPIGIDPTRGGAASAEKVAAYPRPGETADTASVVLWRLTSVTR